MRGNLRRKNRSQAQKEIRFFQNEFAGGWNNDLPGTDLPKDSMALLDNFIAFPEYLEGRSGSQKFSNVTLPGSGTVHSFKQHPTNKKFVLHQGNTIWVSSSTMSSWDFLYTFSATNSGAIAVNGDAANQLSNVVFPHTNYGRVYWNLTNSGSTRTLSVYSDIAKTSLVATGSKVGNGIIYLQQQNNSGTNMAATVAYTIDDTDSANNITCTTASNIVTDDDSTLKEFNNDFLLFVKRSTSSDYIIYIDLTNNCLIKINSGSGVGYGYYKLLGGGTQSSATPYGYRYLYTFSRITTTTGAADSSKNRISGSLVFEGPSNGTLNSTSTDIGIDYGEYWSANPISSGNANTLILTQDGTLNGAANIYLLTAVFAEHYTHISLYRTLDIGVNGTDPITGQGNNREVYVWVGDYDFSLKSTTDTKTDDELRSSFGAGFGLRTRFLKEIVTGEVCEVTNNFIYASQRGTNTIRYGQLTHPENIGYHNQSYQFFKVADGVQILAASPDMLSILCANKTYISSPNSYQDLASGALTSTFVLNHLTLVSDNIGCSDYGSFSKVDAGNDLSEYSSSPSSSFIAHCSDHTIRIWNSSSWSNDLSSRRTNLIVRQMVNGSVGVYCRGVYYIWYRTDSSQTSNNLCLRFGMGRDTGIGWSKVSGSAWVVPPLKTGVCVFIDTNNSQRSLILDIVDSYFYWIETFTSYTGASLSKYFLDKVAVNGSGGTTITCKARFREIVAPEQDDALFHKESHIFDRPYDESVGYASGMQRSLLVYLDGSTTAADTLTNVPNKADLQFFNTIGGQRIQLEAQYTTSQVRLTGFSALLDAQDKMAFGAGPPQYADATNQANLAQNMTIWLCRPYPLLNRATGTSFTLTGTAPTAVTGPDSKTYALSFPSGASYSIASTTSYTNFAVHFWVKSAATSKKIFQMTGTNSFYVQFTANTTLSINGAGNLTVSTIASGFHSFWIIRSGSTVSVYQNGTLNGSTVTVATARGGTTFDINPDGGAMILDDIRVYTTAPVAADITYYYSDVTSTTFTGNKVLPLA